MQNIHCLYINKWLDSQLTTNRFPGDISRSWGAGSLLVQICSSIPGFSIPPLQTSGASVTSTVVLPKNTHLQIFKPC